MALAGSNTAPRVGALQAMAAGPSRPPAHVAAGSFRANWESLLTALDPGSGGGTGDFVGEEGSAAPALATGATVTADAASQCPAGCVEAGFSDRSAAAAKGGSGARPGAVYSSAAGPGAGGAASPGKARPAMPIAETFGRPGGGIKAEPTSHGRAASTATADAEKSVGRTNPTAAHWEPPPASMLIAWRVPVQCEPRTAQASGGRGGAGGLKESLVEASHVDSQRGVTSGHTALAEDGGVEASGGPRPGEGLERGSWAGGQLPEDHMEPATTARVRAGQNLESKETPAAAETAPERGPAHGKASGFSMQPIERGEIAPYLTGSVENSKGMEASRGAAEEPELGRSFNLASPAAERAVQTPYSDSSIGDATRIRHGFAGIAAPRSAAVTGAGSRTKESASLTPSPSGVSASNQHAGKGSFAQPAPHGGEALAEARADSELKGSQPAQGVDREGASSHAVQAGPPSGQSASTRSAFAAMDMEAGAEKATWIHAGARQAEAGYLDPALGWVGVRADLGGGGIHASLVPGSAEAAQALGGQLAGLSHYLNGNHTPVATLTMNAPEPGWTGAGSGGAMQHGGGQQAGQEGGTEPHSSLGAAVRTASIPDGQEAPPPGLERDASPRGSGAGHISVMA